MSTLKSSLMSHVCPLSVMIKRRGMKKWLGITFQQKALSFFYHRNKTLAKGRGGIAAAAAAAAVVAVAAAVVGS